MTVDDSASMRQMISFTLTQAGHQVIEACHGCDAIAKLKGTAPDMLITDLNMPNMDGIKAAIADVPPPRNSPCPARAGASRNDRAAIECRTRAKRTHGQCRAAFYERLREANRVLGCDFFKGVVMTRANIS